MGKRKRYKRKSNAEHLLDFAIKLPWWVCVSLAVVSFFLFGALAGDPPEMVIENRSDIRMLVRLVRFDAICMALHYLFPILFGMAAIGSFIKQYCLNE